MTAHVSLLFIAMIPIDCTITNFPYTCKESAMAGLACTKFSGKTKNAKIATKLYVLLT